MRSWHVESCRSCNVILSPAREDSLGRALKAPNSKFWRSMTLPFRPLPTVALVIPLLTTACVVGPNFKPPAPPPVSRYTQGQQPQTTAATPGVPGGNAQRLVAGADIPADWWA